MVEEKARVIKDACRVLELMKHETLLRMILAYAEKRYEAPWGWVDALNRLLQLKERICK